MPLWQEGNQNLPTNPRVLGAGFFAALLSNGAFEIGEELFETKIKRFPRKESSKSSEGKPTLGAPGAESLARGTILSNAGWRRGVDKASGPGARTHGSTSIHCKRF